jgi:integrase
VIGEGKAYLVYRYRLGGKERELSIGPISEWSLKGARDKHKLLVADVAKKIDPRAAKAAVPTAVPTFGDMADAYVQTHEDTWRNAKHRYQWRQTLTDYCGPIRGLPVDQIATADVLAVLKPLWSRAPETASRLRGRIQTVIEAAQALGHIYEDKANPARWKGHLDHLLAPPKKLGVRGHHKAMPYDHLPEFVKRLRASDNMAALALEFLILTATRTGETLGMQWDEIDRDDAVWSIPPLRMKTHEEFSVPLSERALAILAEARRAARKEPGQDSFVFFGVIPKRPLSDMALSMLMRRMNATETVHGFRTSFRTWASEIGHVEYEIAESCLSHRVGNAVSRAYNRSNLLERRRPVMAAWASYVEGNADPKVVALNDRRKRS